MVTSLEGGGATIALESSCSVGAPGHSRGYCIMGALTEFVQIKTDCPKTAELRENVYYLAMR